MHAVPAFAQPAPGPELAPPRAAPAQGDARQLLEEAKQLYASERYAEALDIFERVYALEPNPAVLFNIGAVHAALHHCELARDAYRRYIELTRLESGRADAREQLERLDECEGGAAPAGTAAVGAVPSEAAPALPPGPAAPPSGTAVALPFEGTAPPSAGPPPAPVASVPAIDIPPPMASDAPPNAMRVAGWVAIGTGGALGLASLGCVYASWRADEAESASPGQSGDAAAREQDAGRRYNALAWGLAGGAVAVAGSGLLLLWLQPDDDTSVQLATAGGGLGLSLERRF